jgi:uncharacterized membrane protein YhaH (DUF805 family)
MTDWKTLLFHLNGRIGQNDFWKGVAVIIGANLLLSFIPLIGGLIWLGLIYVGFCVYGKRLHDAGRSAVLHIIPWVVRLIVGAIVGMVMGGTLLSIILGNGDVDPWALASAGGAVMLLGLLDTFVWVAYTLWVGLAQGDAGENAYGSAPVIEGEAKPIDPA